jgi:hypothetical protein
VRCYIDEADTACADPAAYVASLNWTAGLMLLCEAHARAERDHGDVLWIRSIPSEPATDSDTLRRSDLTHSEHRVV